MPAPRLVAPFAGAWIEILSVTIRLQFHRVAPFAGAWIEIRVYRLPCGEPTSLPSRERGLKSVSRIISHSLFTVAPFAGAWIEMPASAPREWRAAVAPFAGAWIEIEMAARTASYRRCVAPFAGAWIEMRGCRAVHRA